MASNNNTGTYFGASQLLMTLIGPTTIPKVGQLSPIVWPAGSRGRVKLRFRIDGGDLTLGDGTTAHAIGIVAQVAQRYAQGGVSKPSAPELVGFAGIAMGGVMPVVPMLNAGGATPREWSQVVELVPGFNTIGLAGLAADEAIAGGLTFLLIAEPIVEG